jgi:putative membrane protein
MITEVKPDKKYLNLIKMISLLIPVVVIVLLYIPEKLDLGRWVFSLPHVIAVINMFTSVVLSIALIAIKLKNIQLHKNLMLVALGLGAMFLITYVLYHSSVPSTVFGDINRNGILEESELSQVRGLRKFYLSILFSHISLSIIVLPLVLMAFYFALSAQISKHVKLVKFTYPVWLYVSVSGVVIYFLISPYYV